MTGYDIINIILTGINVIITFASGVGAYKSWKYYKKSNALATHTNIKSSLLEIETIKNKLVDIVLATNNAKKNSRGFNLENTIGEYGKEISTSYNQIHAILPAKISEGIIKLETANGFSLQCYINRCVSGDVLIDGALDNKELALCQNCLTQVQEFLKGKLEENAEMLK